MPSAIYPMLATSIEAPFDSPEWFFEIKWDGYRAIAFLEKGNVRLVSRKQNDLTGQYSDLHDMAKYVNARRPSSTAKSSHSTIRATRPSA